MILAIMKIGYSEQIISLSSPLSIYQVWLCWSSDIMSRFHVSQKFHYKWTWLFWNCLLGISDGSHGTSQQSMLSTYQMVDKESLSGYDAASLTVDHSGSWRMPLYLHSKDLFYRFSKKKSRRIVASKN